MPASQGQYLEESTTRRSETELAPVTEIFLTLHADATHCVLDRPDGLHPIYRHALSACANALSDHIALQQMTQILELSDLPGSAIACLHLQACRTRNQHAFMAEV